MKNKSLFFIKICVIILALICIMLTIGVSILVGSVNAELFDFSSLNFLNMIPVLIIGIFISCVIIGICILFVIRTAFVKTKNYFKENNNDGGNKK